MRKEILALLIAKFVGVSEQILSRIATNMAKTATTDEEVTSSVEGVTLQFVIDSQADYRAHDATVNAVFNYEKKHGLKDGQKAAGGESTTIEPNPKDDDTPPWAKTLIEQGKTLNERMSTLEGDKVSSTRKSQLAKALEGLTEAQKKPYSRIKFDDYTDEAFVAELEDITTEADEVRSDNKRQGVIITPPRVTKSTISNEAPSKKETNEVRAAMGLSPEE